MSGDDHFIKPDSDRETDLLPCPFCSGEAKRHDIEAREDVDNAGASYIECSRCGACTQLHFDRKENLLSSWNDRARAYDPTTQPYDEPFKHVNTDADQLRGMLEIERRISAERLQEVERLKSLLRRLAACEGGSWNVERYAKERATLLEEAHSLIETSKAGVAEQSGAGAPETSVQCGAPAANSAP